MLDAVKSGIGLVQPGMGERLDIFGLGLEITALPEEGGILMAWHDVPPGLGVPLHGHEAEDEIFLVTQGRLTLLSREGEATAGPGTTILLPRGEPHGFRNDGAEPVRMLVVVTPGCQAARMFRALDRLTRDAAPAGPAPEAIGRICAAHGVRFA